MKIVITKGRVRSWQPPAASAASGWLDEGSPCARAVPALEGSDVLVRAPEVPPGARAGERRLGRGRGRGRGRLRLPGRALLAAARASAAERWRYPADLVGGAAFLLVILFVFSRLWREVGGGGDVGGLSVAQLLAYLAVAELVVLSPGHCHERIADEVRSGAFAVLLLRPIHHARWELARALGSAAVRGLLVFALGAVGVVVLAGVPRLDPRGVALGLLVLVPLALVLACCARVILGQLAFWVEDSAPFYWIWQKLCFVLGGLFLPLELYPEWLREIALWLPFSALLHGPARTVVAYEPAFAASAALRLAAWTVVFVAVSHALDAAGRRRVQLNGG